METLRLLANIIKHEPFGGPAEYVPDDGRDDLRKHLHLDLNRHYAPLAESSAVREGLAVSLDLEKNADYCAIAEQFLKRADEFLTAVKQQPGLRLARLGAVSLNPDDAAW